jgi:hypothetical protein
LWLDRVREAMAQAIPDRPFTVAFWDGTELEGTADGPRFRSTGFSAFPTSESRRKFCMLRAPI